MFKLQYGVVLPELNTNSLDEKLATFLASPDAKRSVRNVFTGVRITRGTVYTIDVLGYKSFTVKDEDTGKNKDAYYASIDLISPSGTVSASIKTLLDVDGFLTNYATDDYQSIVALLSALRGLKVMFQNDNLRHVIPKNGGREFDAHNRDWQALQNDGTTEMTDAELNAFIANKGYKKPKA